MILGIVDNHVEREMTNILSPYLSIKLSLRKCLLTKFIEQFCCPYNMTIHKTQYGAMQDQTHRTISPTSITWLSQKKSLVVLFVSEITVKFLLGSCANS